MERMGRERLDAFIPRFLAQAVEHDQPSRRLDIRPQRPDEPIALEQWDLDYDQQSAA